MRDDYGVTYGVTYAVYDRDRIPQLMRSPGPVSGGTQREMTMRNRTSEVACPFCRLPMREWENRNGGGGYNCRDDGCGYYEDHDTEAERVFVDGGLLPGEVSASMNDPKEIIGLSVAVYRAGGHPRWPSYSYFRHFTRGAKVEPEDIPF